MTETTFRLLDYAWGVFGGLLMIIWNMLNNKITEHKSTLEKQIEASHTTLSKRIDEANEETDTQRGHIAKIFDKLDDMRSESQKRHIELMTAIHTGLDKKADK